MSDKTSASLREIVEDYVTEKPLSKVEKLARINKVLEHFVGQENITQWLNTPNPQLENKTAQWVIDNLGERGVDCILAMLTDALLGQPS